MIFYDRFIRDFLKEEISAQGLTKEIKKAIASEIHSLLIPCIRLGSCMDEAENAALEIVDRYN